MHHDFEWLASTVNKNRLDMLICFSGLQGNCFISILDIFWVGTLNPCHPPWSWARRWWRGWGACRVNNTRSSGNSATLPSCTCAGELQTEDIHANISKFDFLKEVNTCSTDALNWSKVAVDIDNNKNCSWAPNQHIRRIEMKVHVTQNTAAENSALPSLE